MNKIQIQFEIIDSKDLKRGIMVETNGKEIECPHDIKRINLSPITKITQLEKLTIQSQYLDSINLTPLGNCKNLKTLNLAGNNLTEIDLSPLSGCENLTFLNLSANPLKTLDLKPLENSRIKFLHLFFNTELLQLIITPLFSCSELEGFYIAPDVELIANRIWEDGFEIPPALQKINHQIKWVDTEEAHLRSIVLEEEEEMDEIDDERYLMVEPGKTNEVKIMRGGEVVGGKFAYKVKVQNNSKYVVTNIFVNIVAYPQDCMNLIGENSKMISRIEPGGFRSPQFIFSPTKDCVEGKILATVSYIDHENSLQLEPVNPFTIRSVCDLLIPLRQSPEIFDKLIMDMESTSEKQTMDWNPQILFLKAEKLLPIRNFHVIDSNSKVTGGLFTGTIRGFAEGKYTGKKVAIQTLISGLIQGNESTVVIEGMGEDIAMVPTTIEEISHGIESWICMRCGGPIDIEGVTKIKQNIPIACQYCKQTLTIDLYRR